MGRWAGAFALCAALMLLAACAEDPRERASPPKLAPPEQRADRLLVEKAARRLTLFRENQVIARYNIGLGFAPEGDKRREGDGRTPEGWYEIDYRNPNSRFHLSLHVSYPDARDRAEAKALGVDPGGEIFIHGYGGLIDWFAALWRHGDWTAGCIAVTNDQIEEIWSLTPNGVPIEIRP